MRVVSEQARPPVSPLARFTPTWLVGQERLLATAAFGALIAGLIAAYIRLASSIPVNSDNASLTLEGQDLLRGNVLLHGWTLSTASFYASDLVVYAAAVALRGPRPGAVHVAGPIIYGLLVLVALILARGRQTGRQGALAMMVALVPLLAPAGAGAIYLLLQSPHVGTTLLVLLAFLVLDRYGFRWQASLVAAAILAAAVSSDQLAVVAGALPLLFVSALQLARRGPAARAAVWPLLAAVASVLAGSTMLGAVAAAGGFRLIPSDSYFVSSDLLVSNLGTAATSLLGLSGADFLGRKVFPSAVRPLVHLTGLTFMAAVSWRVGREWIRGSKIDFVSQVLLAGIVLDLLAFVFSSQTVNFLSARYLIPCLVFGAVLAGREGAEWLRRRRLALLAALVAAAYAALFAYSLAVPQPQESNIRPLAVWLAQHDLHSGYGTYWLANGVTLESGGAVTVRAVSSDGTGIQQMAWETNSDWYGPGNGARFVVFIATMPDNGIDQQRLVSVFGPPSEVDRVGDYEVLVWDHDLAGPITKPAR